MGDNKFEDDSAPVEYDDAKKIPYKPSGNDPFIGLGSFGVVDRVKDSSDVEAVRKTISITATGAEKDNLISSSKNEIIKKWEVVQRIRHAHVAHLRGAYFYKKSENELQFSVIMEPADMNLHSYIKNGEIQPKWFGCLINALAYTHELGIQHKGIKPTNILIQGDRVLLTDFIFSKLDLGEALTTLRPKWVHDNTASHCAPEVVDNRAYGRSADIFSLGTVFLEMLFAPFYSNKMTMKLVKVLRRSGIKSYAHNLDMAHEWMDRMLSDDKLPEGKREIFIICGTMMSKERDQRPTARDLDTQWSENPSLKGFSCSCDQKTAGSESDQLIEACKRGSKVNVDRLLKSVKHPDWRGALQQASAAGKLDVVQTLLDRNDNVDEEDFAGQTALHHAAKNGHKDVIELLLRKRANINKRDDQRRSPIQLAAGQGYDAVCKFLCEKKADLKVKDSTNRTVLHYAARSGNGKMVRLFLDAGVDIEAIDEEGRTALHLATSEGSDEVVDLILKYSMKTAAPDKMKPGQKPPIIDMRDEHGYAALQLAAKNGHTSVFTMLMERGADITVLGVPSREYHRLAIGST